MGSIVSKSSTISSSSSRAGIKKGSNVIGLGSSKKTRRTLPKAIINDNSNDATTATATETNYAATIKSPLNRTKNIDHLQKIKNRLDLVRSNDINGSNDQQALAQQQQQQQQQLLSNKTMSDFITKRLSNLDIQREILKLNPNHSSLKRLSYKKKLEDDYKKLIENGANGANNGASAIANASTTVLEVPILKQILEALQNKQTINHFKLNHKTQQKIFELSKGISIPTVKINLSSSNNSHAQRQEQSPEPQQQQTVPNNKISHNDEAEPMSNEIDFNNLLGQMIRDSANADTPGTSRQPHHPSRAKIQQHEVKRILS